MEIDREKSESGCSRIRRELIIVATEAAKALCLEGGNQTSRASVFYELTHVCMYLEKCIGHIVFESHVFPLSCIINQERREELN